MVTDDVEQLIGRKPITFDQFACDYALEMLRLEYYSAQSWFLQWCVRAPPNHLNVRRPTKAASPPTFREN
jgi:hypothetical protein